MSFDDKGQRGDAVQLASQYDGMQVSDAKRLRSLKEENRRLKKLLAEEMLDNAALKDVPSGEF